MLNSRHLRLLGVVISGILGSASAMDYEPFPNCTDAAQVDSTRKLVYKDESLKPELAPYSGYNRYRYFPGSCYPLQVIYQLYYLRDQVYRIDYQKGSAPGVLEFVWTMTELDSSFLFGTEYFSASGGIDSSKSWHINPSESGGLDTDFVLGKTTRTPEYQLIRNYRRIGHASMEYVWGDSIVATATGKTVYSVDGEDTVVTRCGNVGATYVCEESPSPNGFRPRKSIWFLTQGRKDSLQTWEDGELLSTEKYFWSARTAGIRAPRIRGKATAATSIWDEFDIMGRNKAWLRTRF